MAYFRLNGSRRFDCPLPPTSNGEQSVVAATRLPSLWPTPIYVNGSRRYDRHLHLTKNAMQRPLHDFHLNGNRQVDCHPVLSTQ